jgi:hypothetical protein
MRQFVISGVVLAAVIGLAGCRSKYIEATLENKTGEPVSLVQVEYPSASFGTQQLLPAASFHYRFKLIGSGAVKVSWVDAMRGEHQQNGPQLLEGEQGQLSIVFTKKDHVDFSRSVRP